MMCSSCALEACSRRDRLVQSSNHDMQFHAYLKLSTSRRSPLQAPILGASQRESPVQPSEHAKNKIPTNQPLLPPVDVLHASVCCCMRAGVEPHGSLARYEFRQRHMLTKLTRALRHESWHGPKQSLPITFGYSTHALNTHR